MSVEVMATTSSALEHDSFFKQETVDEEFEESESLDGSLAVNCKLNGYVHPAAEEEEEEVEYQFVDEDDELAEQDGDEYEVVEIDENDIMYEDCVLMPFRDRIKTKPQIKIRTKFDFVDTKLYVPPSKCSQTLNERFSEFQSKLLKYQINPIFGLGGWNRLTPQQKRNRRSAFSRLGYFYKPKSYNRAQQLAAMKLKKRSIKQLTPIVEDGNLYSRQGYWRKKFRWFSREPATREELDEEIDEYMAQRGKVQDSEMAEENEGEGEGEVLQENGVLSSGKKSKILSMAERIKLWHKNAPVSHDHLDRELDDYMKHSKNALDAELDEYMAQAASAKAAAAAVATLTCNGIETNGAESGIPQENGTADMDISCD